MDGFLDVDCDKEQQDRDGQVDRDQHVDDMGGNREDEHHDDRNHDDSQHEVAGT